MSDLTERLREVAPVVEENFDVFTGELLTDAADEIERLRDRATAAEAREAKLRELLHAAVAGEWQMQIPTPILLAVRAALAESSAKP